MTDESAIGFFAGAGGRDLGVDAAGFKTLCSVEYDTHCAATLQTNARRKAVQSNPEMSLNGTVAGK